MKKLPALSPEEIREIETEAGHYEQKQAASIEALKIIQKHRGWVSDESLAAAAELLEMSPAELDGVATFYNLIFRKPVGEHVVMVCDSVSCWLLGCDKIAEQFKQRLGIEYGQTTKDGKVTLLPVTCQGACDKAPLVLLDGELETNLDADGVDQLLENKCGNVSLQ